jgi:hypothetical protein
MMISFGWIVRSQSKRWIEHFTVKHDFAKTQMVADAEYLSIHFYFGIGARDNLLQRRQKRSNRTTTVQRRKAAASWQDDDLSKTWWEPGLPAGGAGHSNRLFAGGGGVRQMSSMLQADYKLGSS